MIGAHLSLAVGGQSLAQIFRKRGRKAFALRMGEIAPAAPPVKIWGYTRGGSLAASTNRFPAEMTAGQHWWWDMERDAPSPDFAAGVDELAPFFAHPCEALLWDLGQSEAMPMAGAFGRDPGRATADYLQASRRCLAFLRERLSPGDPARVPILFMPHAPHPHDARPGNGRRRVREAQLELIRSIPNCHDVGVVEGMEMLDHVHPTQNGLDVYAARVADCFARVVLGLDVPLLTRPLADMLASA